MKNAGYSEARESGLARLRDRQPRAGRAALTETARATRRVPLHSEDHHALVRLQRDCLVADLDKLPGELVVPGPVAMHRDVTDDLALGQVGLRVPPLDRRVERGLPRVEVRDGGRASSRRLETPGRDRARPLRLAQTCPAPCCRTLNQTVFVPGGAFLSMAHIHAWQRNEPNRPRDALPTPRQPETAVDPRTHQISSSDGSCNCLAAAWSCCCAWAGVHSHFGVAPTAPPARPRPRDPRRRARLF